MLGGGGDADTKRLGTPALTYLLEVLIGLYLTTLYWVFKLIKWRFTNDFIGTNIFGATTIGIIF
jgi:hypothetical protein